jgi:hypothetical protein
MQAAPGAGTTAEVPGMAAAHAPPADPKEPAGDRVLMLNSAAAPLEGCPLRAAGPGVAGPGNGEPSGWPVARRLARGWGKPAVAGPVPGADRLGRSSPALLSLLGCGAATGVLGLLVAGLALPAFDLSLPAGLAAREVRLWQVMATPLAGAMAATAAAVPAAEAALWLGVLARVARQGPEATALPVCPAWAETCLACAPAAAMLDVLAVTVLVLWAVVASFDTLRGRPRAEGLAPLWVAGAVCQPAMRWAGRRALEEARAWGEGGAGGGGGEGPGGGGGEGGGSSGGGGGRR